MLYSPSCSIVNIICPDDTNRTTAKGRRVQPDILRILDQKDTGYTKFSKLRKPDCFIYVYPVRSFLDADS